MMIMALPLIGKKLVKYCDRVTIKCQAAPILLQLVTGSAK